MIKEAIEGELEKSGKLPYLVLVRSHFRDLHQLRELPFSYAFLKCAEHGFSYSSPKFFFFLILLTHI